MQAIAGISASAIFSFLAASFFSSAYQQYKNNKQNPQTSTDAQSDDDSNASENNFFKFTTITPPLRIIHYPHFTILYSTYHKSPLAVHQLITKETAEGDAPRAKFFYPDDNITQKHFQVDNSYFYETQAYARFNLNRGHMAAAGNYSGNESFKFNTFTFANVVPQDGQNNGGIWNTFERYARNLALSNKCESGQIISGPIFPKNSPFSKQAANKQAKIFTSVLKVLKQDGAIIPQKLYKIIICNSKNGPYLNAYQFLNEETQDNSKVLNSFEVDLKNIESQTGLRFNIAGKPLSGIDQKTLKQTKKELDYPFYFSLMANSSKIGEMMDGLRRARSQKIEIQLNDLTDKVRELTKKQMEQLSKEQISSCERVKKVLYLNRKLSSLKHLQKTQDLRIQKSKQLFYQCKKSQKQYELLGSQFKIDLTKLQQALQPTIELKSQSPQ